MLYFGERPDSRTPADNKPFNSHIFYLQQAYAVSILLLQNKLKICLQHFCKKKYLVNHPHVFYKTIERLSKIFNNGIYDFYLEQININEIDTLPNLSDEKSIVDHHLFQLKVTPLPEKLLQNITYQLEQLKQNISMLEGCYRTLPSLRKTLEKFNPINLYPMTVHEK